MGKISGMQRYAEQFAQAKVEATQRLISQYMIDTLQMTLHQTEGWGYDRIMRLTEAWQQTQKEYTPALNSNDPSADVTQLSVTSALTNGPARCRTHTNGSLIGRRSFFHQLFKPLAFA